jgi:Rrf2 family protein
MRMSDAVEWSIHCCSLLAALPEDQALPASRLAEYHDVPPAYLAKALQAMAAAGIVESRPGPSGGYRLARPPMEITLLEIVQAVDGPGTAFRCTEIRQRGPAAIDEPGAYRVPCGIARAMWRAEDAWRAELAATTVSDMVIDFLRVASPERVQRGVEWIQDVHVRRRSRGA